MKIINVFLLVSVICLVGAGSASAQQAAKPAATPAPVLTAMEQELTRSLATLGKSDPPAYFLGYTVTETQRAEVMGSNGALLSSLQTRSRWLEVQVRTGNYDLDNTRKVGERGGLPPGGSGAQALVDDDAAVLRRTVWLETDRQYRAAAEALIKIQTGKEVQVETAEGRAPDFSKEQPHTSVDPAVSIQVDRHPCRPGLRFELRAPGTRGSLWM